MKLPMRLGLAALTLAALLTVFSPTATAAEAETARPNLIFIMADDLGYGDLGCYGQEKIKTPTLDQLAAEGMRFTQFYAGSTVCAPSRCCLMTGLHTGRAFIRGNGKDNLRPQDVTVAEVLKKVGYRTALIGKWGLGHEGSTGLPTRQGFDYFFGYLDQHHAHNYYPTFLIRNGERVELPNVVPGEGKWGQGVAREKKVYSHDLMMEEALSFVDRAKEEPFFLYLALTIPHANNEAGRAGMEVPDLGSYADRDWPAPQKGHAAMIERMDRDLGRLMDRLKQHGIDQKTVVLFTSDNGPHAEGGNDPHFADSNGPLTGIKRSLHEGGIRVPLLARWPGKIEPGSTNDHLGASWDVLPTLAELGGAEKHVPEGLDGISFAPALLGEAQPEHDFLYWAFYEGGGAQAIRAGRWKAIQQPIHSEIRLYDLDEDVAEKQDLATDHPELVKKFRRQMEESYEPSDRWKFPRRR